MLSPAAPGQGWKYPTSIRSQNVGLVLQERAESFGLIRSAQRECRMKRATNTNGAASEMLRTS